MKPIFENGKLRKEIPEKENWVKIFCPYCEEEIMKINLKSYLPGYISSISCSRCGLRTRDWYKWIKK